MNLFILDENPVIAAQYNNDYHVRKIILEALLMMGFAYPDGKYCQKNSRKHPHYNHPMSKWVRQTRKNFMWTLNHCISLQKEYQYRSKHGRPHATVWKTNWIIRNLPQFNEINFTTVPRCFKDYYDVIPITSCPVRDYRNYYNIGKTHLASWSKRDVPAWYKENTLL